MKNFLIVEADKIGAASKVLPNIYGVTKVVHWNGRRARPPTCLPKGVSIVIIVVGYVNHNYVRRIKELTDETDIPVTYVSRGLSGLKISVERRGKPAFSNSLCRRSPNRFIFCH